MSNSPLVTYERITKHRTTPRNHKIDTITIHCYVGQVTAKQGVDYFATTDRDVSSNYVVGKDGSIGLSVPESDRSWCSSNRDNDHRAVTIEMACDKTAPYAVTDKAYEALINLVADICKRNNIKELLWEGDKSLIGNISRQNMTVHRWFSKTECPGEYLYSRLGDIASKVNAKLGVIEDRTPITSNSIVLSNTPLYSSSTAKTPSSYKTGTYYYWSSAVVKGRIRITNKESNIGVKGQVTGWIDAVDSPTVPKVEAPPTPPTSDSKASFLVRVNVSALNVRAKPSLESKVTHVIRDRGVYTIVDTDGSWGKLKSGLGWIHLDYVMKVGK